MTSDKQAEVADPGSAGIVYKRLLRYLRPHRARLVAALATMVIFGASDGVIPYLLKRILDDIFGARDKTMLWVLVFAIVGFAMFRAVFGFLEHYLSSTLGLRVIEDLRNELTAHLVYLTPSFFSSHSSGALISRMTNDTLLVRRALTDAAVGFLRDSVRIVALLVAAFYLDPTLALIAFVGLPIGIIPIIRFGRKVRKYSKTGQEQFGGMTSILHEIIVGHKVVQAFTMEKKEQERFALENQRSTETLSRAAMYGSISGPTNEVLGSIAIAFVIMYGGMSVLGGVRTQGEFIAFITAMFLLYDPLKKMGRLNNTIQQGVASAERIFEVLDTVPDVTDAADAIHLELKHNRIEFRNVSFSYPRASIDETGEQIIDSSRPAAVANVSLIVEPGQRVALVGLSGSGKSTLVSLLLRFYDPQSGTITVGNSDIKKVTLESLRSAIAVVDQHTFLFNDTARNNIAYGRLGATDEEVIAAARAANAENFIRQLPQGIDTVIGEQGLTLSGGERARISIARALLKNAPILVLDEATANLDSESEQLVQGAIDRLMESRTVLVIAHRLATVRSADNIVVMSRGNIVETGTHKELLARDGEYAKLYRLQFLDEVEQSEETARAAG